jgi:hypothetical protein
VWRIQEGSKLVDGTAPRDVRVRYSFDEPTMYIDRPRWQLLALCPECGQPSLILVACPACSHVSVICAEEGSAFVNPRIALSKQSAVWPDSTPCPGCGAHVLSDFALATGEEIQQAGHRVGEYE